MYLGVHQHWWRVDRGQLLHRNGVPNRRRWLLYWVFRWQAGTWPNEWQERLPANLRRGWLLE